jgi:3-deoxy-manno-octulosonate cytidylyltransferase (CMP-KDO synthetase)
VSAFRVVIPARYGATRLPGKPLRELLGRPLVAHVIDRGRESGAQEVIVAADDERICAVAREAGARAVMTSPDHASGTDRIAEVAELCGFRDDEIIINLQGDEPALEPALLQQVARQLADKPDAQMATAATSIRDAQTLFDPNVVKVVIGDDGRARYFSRAPIPWVRGHFEPGQVPGRLPPDVPFFRHIGIYGYRVCALRRLCREAPRAVEQAESLEQLRALALGIEIHVAIVDEPLGHGVDTEADLARAEVALRRRMEPEKVES